MPKYQCYDGGDGRSDYVDDVGPVSSPYSLTLLGLQRLKCDSEMRFSTWLVELSGKTLNILMLWWFGFIRFALVRVFPLLQC